MRRRAMQDKMETIYDLFMRMKVERDSVREGTRRVESPFDGRSILDTPNQNEYWKARARLDGFLMALDWSYEEKDGWLIIRRNNDNRLKAKIKI